MAERLKLAFVGCGAIARYHLDGINEHAPRIQVTATVDVDAEKAQAYATETGGTAFTSLEEALEKGDFDAVDLMLPHDLHEQAAIQCFEAGKHALLEKPMSLDLDSCDRILAAARSTGTVFMMAENAQYWPEIVKAAEVIESGAIGDIITARAAFTYEFDPVWFWLLFLLNITLGAITPPFGYVMFAVKAAAPDVSMGEIFSAAWLFVGLTLIGMILLAIFPDIVTFLPNLMDSLAQ